MGDCLLQHNRTPVGLGDGTNDRQAEAEGAAPVTGAADEALEEGGGDLRGHAGAVVLDHE